MGKKIRLENTLLGIKISTNNQSFYLIQGNNSRFYNDSRIYRMRRMPYSGKRNNTNKQS